MSAQPDTDELDALCENTLIALFNSDTVSRACNPDHWDSDRPYKQPMLIVKCLIGEQLIPGVPVYGIHCEVTLDGKPTRFRFNAAWKKIHDMLRLPTLHYFLSNDYITIGSNAEDFRTQPNITGDLRKRVLTFTLRGYSRT